MPSAGYPPFPSTHLSLVLSPSKFYFLLNPIQSFKATSPAKEEEEVF